MQQGELVQGTATITLSGFEKPTDLTVIAGLTQHYIENGRIFTLKGCTNGVQRIVLSRTVGLTVPFDSLGPDEFSLNVIPKGVRNEDQYKPVTLPVEIREIAETDGTLGISDVSIACPQSNHGESIRLGETVTLNCSFRAKDKSGHGVSFRATQGLLLMGPDFKAFDDVAVTHKLNPGAEFSPSQKFVATPKLAGRYIAQYKLVTNRTKTILVCWSFNVIAPGDNVSIQITHAAGTPASVRAGATFAINAHYVATDPANKNPTVQEQLEISGPETASLPVNRRLSDADNGQNVSYNVTAFKPGRSAGDSSRSWELRKIRLRARSQ